MFDNIIKQLEGLPPLAWNAMITAIAVIIGLIFKWILSLLLKKYSIQANEYSLFRSILHRLGKPVALFLPLFVFNLMMPFMHLTKEELNIIDRITGLLLIVSFAVLLIGIVQVFQDIVMHKYDLSAKDNLKARKIRTQLQFLKKMVISIIIILTACAVL